jgi:hypothetical protein
MGMLFYSLEGAVLKSEFFGFTLSLPAGWRVSTARVSGGKALLWLAPASGHSDQLTLTLFPRDDAGVAKYFQDEELARRTFPGRAVYPFGEAITAPVCRRRLLAQANDLIVQVDEKEGAPETVSGMEAILRSLRFFEPQATAVPPELKAFRYLHPLVRSGRAAAPARLVNAELEARWHDLRSRDYLYDAAIVGALLGRGEEARALFAEASHQLERLAFERAPGDLGLFASALEAALFSGSDHRVSELARRTPCRPSRSDLVLDRRVYSRALGLLALGDDKGCAAELSEVREGAAARAWMVGLSELTRCVLECDHAGFPAALTGVLEGHDRKARSKRSEIWNSARSFVCAPATALAVLGSRRGLSLPDPLPARRSTLSGLLVVCAPATPEGPVLPGTTMELTVDYLAPALLGAL